MRAHAPNEPPDKAYLEKWYARTMELIDKYKPDLLYFDSPLPLGDYGLRVAAHFYNANKQWHGGRLEAVLNVKSYGPGSIPDERAIVLDIEKGQSGAMRALPWQTDTSLNRHWFFDQGKIELTAPQLIRNLADIVSKNGNLLLNVGLRPDGTLPEDQKLILDEVGAWLRVNGEAIYGTRPWEVFGEGPTQVEDGHFKQQTKPYTSEDFRFTTKPDALYAICLDRPGKQVVIHSLADKRKLWLGDVRQVWLLGYPEPLNWKRTAEGLQVEMPASVPGSPAYVLKVTGSRKAAK